MSSGPHRFQPGNTAAAGHKANDRSIITKLRRALEDRGDEFVAMMMRKAIDEQDFRYADSLMDRTYGKPVQAVAQFQVSAVWSDLAGADGQLPEAMAQLLLPDPEQP